MRGRVLQRFGTREEPTAAGQGTRETAAAGVITDALTVSTAGGAGSASYNLSPFIAARPLTNAQLIAAKLKMTVWSTALAWLLVLIAIPIGLQLSGEMPLVVERSRRFAEIARSPAASHRRAVARSGSR